MNLVLICYNINHDTTKKNDVLDESILQITGAFFRFSFVVQNLNSISLQTIFMENSFFYD